MRATVLFAFLFSFSTLFSACTSYNPADPCYQPSGCSEVPGDDDSAADDDDVTPEEEDPTPDPGDDDDDSSAGDDDTTPPPDDDDTTPDDDDSTSDDDDITPDPGDDDSGDDDDDSATGDDDSAGDDDDDDTTPPPAPTAQECWDSVAFTIQNRAIDWSTATTVSGNWTNLSWVDTDPVQVLDASSATAPVTMWQPSSCGISAETPSSLYLPTGYSFPDLGEQYNNGIITALQPDGTVLEVNYLQDCGDGSWAGWVLPDSSPLDACDEGIDATRWLGAHGGSHFTATQALREGELTGSSAIARPLPVEVDHTHLYYGSDGFRWPAASADGYASSLYSGGVSDVQMGSILVLPESYDCTVMSTVPGERLCEVARDHGMIVVDDSYGEDEVAFPITPEAQVEVEGTLGYSLHNSQATGFGGDVEDIFGDILVLTNPEAAWVE